MADKLKEYVRQTIDEILANTPAKERLKGLTPAERLEGLSAEELLKRLTKITRALSPDAREALFRQLKTNGDSHESP